MPFLSAQALCRRQRFLYLPQYIGCGRERFGPFRGQILRFLLADLDDGESASPVEESHFVASERSSCASETRADSSKNAHSRGEGSRRYQQVFPCLRATTR